MSELVGIVRMHLPVRDVFRRSGGWESKRDATENC